MHAQALSRAEPLPIPTASPSVIADLVRDFLAPQVLDIDLKGVYPGEFMRKLGAAGVFAGHISKAYGGSEQGLSAVIDAMEIVGKECLSTAFLVWCQSACAWYLENSENEALKAAYLPDIAAGRILAGTGLSNPMKSCAAIEDIRLRAQRVDDGYVINGTLPWVSNIEPDHMFAVGVAVEGKPDLLIALADGGLDGLTMNQNAHFVALEGTNTFACQFKNVFLPDARVIAHPDQFPTFLSRIKSGFILLQMGMGLGLIDACAGMMRQSDKTLAHVNQFLDDQAEDIEAALAGAREQTRALASDVYAKRDHSRLRDVLAVRIAGSELSLRAANAAMLHMGAKGYLLRNPAQRRLREAYFVAIVTPALKHLRKELHELDHAPCGCN
jgi:alkylation response protein AidB-like acyl-CoA dehydrogenase